MNNSQKEIILEDWTGSCLQTLKNQGHILDYRLLLRSLDIPDYWVLDAKRREWLWECKNISPKIHLKPGNHPVGSQWEIKLWWVKGHISDKKWQESSYPIRDNNSHDSHWYISTNVSTWLLVPGLIISKLNIEPDALMELKRLFGKNIVVFDGLLTPSSKAAKDAIREGLRRALTSDDAQPSYVQ